MYLPTIYGTIERRILVNFRVDVETLAAIVPPPFQVKPVRGYGLAGVCLIRLNEIGPRFWPAKLGIKSENMAHRIAVEWEQGGQRREGVYIPRRDTSSRLNSLVGGRLFPGMHHHARFDVCESEDRYEVRVASDDGDTRLAVVGRLADDVPAGSVFHSLAEASDFFLHGSLGYSVSATPGRYDGLRLDCRNWKLEPLAIDEVHSSFFADKSRFPPGAATFDSAFLMRNIAHQWHSEPCLCSSPQSADGAFADRYAKAK